MSDVIIYQCPYINKTVRNNKGELIESPCCRGNYCSRCCWYRKRELMGKATHNKVIVNCFHTMMVLPYYKPIPRDIKTKINRTFWQAMRRKYKELAYLHSLEQQGGLLHANYYLLTDVAIDPEWVKERWALSLQRAAKITLDHKHATVEPISNREAVTRYVLKTAQRNPQEYLPERGRYKKLYYTSPNWTLFIEQRCEDTLLLEILD